VTRTFVMADKLVALLCHESTGGNCHTVVTLHNCVLPWVGLNFQPGTVVHCSGSQLGPSRAYFTKTTYVRLGIQLTNCSIRALAATQYYVLLYGPICSSTCDHQLVNKLVPLCSRLPVNRTLFVGKIEVHRT
jgi:hypothetical protein